MSVKNEVECGAFPASSTSPNIQLLCCWFLLFLLLLFFSASSWSIFGLIFVSALFPPEIECECFGPKKTKTWFSHSRAVIIILLLGHFVQVSESSHLQTRMVIFRNKIVYLKWKSFSCRRRTLGNISPFVLRASVYMCTSRQNEQNKNNEIVCTKASFSAPLLPTGRLGDGSSNSRMPLGCFGLSAVTVTHSLRCRWRRGASRAWETSTSRQ